MRAGRALREKWADEARRAARQRDPVARAQDAAEQAARDRRHRVLARYGRLLRAGHSAGTLTLEEAFARYAAAEDRTASRLHDEQARIFGW